MSNRFTGTITVGKRPSDTHTVYIANSGKSTVSVIDGTTRTVTATVPLRRSSNVAVDPETHIVYVTDTDDGTVSIIERVAG